MLLLCNAMMLMTSAMCTKAFPFAFPTIAITKRPTTTTQRKKGERRKGGKEKKENRNESKMGPLLVGGPSSLLTSYKLFFLFLHKQNTSFHTLGAHAPPWIKSQRVL
jgi:hypothetical protein